MIYFWTHFQYAGETHCDENISASLPHVLARTIETNAQNEPRCTGYQVPWPQGWVSHQVHVRCFWLISFFFYIWLFCGFFYYFQHVSWRDFVPESRNVKFCYCGLYSYSLKIQTSTCTNILAALIITTLASSNLPTEINHFGDSGTTKK